MEQFAIVEATGNAPPSTANATAALTGAYGGEKGIKEITVPEVLMHLVGHVEGSSEMHDNDGPAPDEDYIVGGTGVVKALQYVLGEKANDDKRHSFPSTPSGTITPRERPGSSAGLVDSGKAKKMSKNLLGSARKIRDRLQPALVKEAAAGDEMAYRRLMFLDQTLESMIARFEAEYPETRLAPPSPKHAASEASSLTDQSNLLASSINTQGTEFTNNASDEEEFFSGEENAPGQLTDHRRNSDVNLVSRAQRAEEGHLHRIGQVMRREVIDSPRGTEFGADVPWKQLERHEHESERLRRLGERIESFSGGELKTLIDQEGWDNVMKKVGGTYDDLRMLQEQDPEGWEGFKEAHMKARINADRGSVSHPDG